MNTHNHTETFVGRPDGLGNRIEELCFLLAKHRKQNTTFTYLWNNIHSSRRDRVYPVLLTAPSAAILPLTDAGVSRQHNQPLCRDFTTEEIFAAGATIQPQFAVPEQLSTVTGVHIRRGDKIRANPAFNEMSAAQSALAQKCALEFVNQQCSEVFVCGDDAQAVQSFISGLHDGITVHSYSNRSVPAEYFDYFCLARCQQVVMASRFSSYAITASLLGNSPLHSFFHNQHYPGDIGRYRCHEINHGIIT